VRRSIRNVNLAKDWLRHERALMSDIVSCYLAMPDGRQQALAVVRATKAAAFRDLVRESAVFAFDWPPEEAAEATALWRTIRELNIALENNAGIIGDEVADYEARVTLNERRRELAALAERRMPDLLRQTRGRRPR
jgi:hypothetical protein